MKHVALLELLLLVDVSRAQDWSCIRVGSLRGSERETRVRETATQGGRGRGGGGGERGKTERGAVVAHVLTLEDSSFC